MKEETKETVKKFVEGCKAVGGTARKDKNKLICEVTLEEEV